MNNRNFEYETGITTHVLSLKSKSKVVDVINKIIQKKSIAIFNWVESIKNKNNIEINNIVIVGGYLTGIGIANLLSNYYNDITIVDIYHYIQDLVRLYKIDFNLDNSAKIIKNNDLKESKQNTIKFSTDISLIQNTDLLIDTTGLGGLNLDESKLINGKIFLIEDPIAEDNDYLLKEKNNINERLNSANTRFKGILKTKGLNTKTSGTMTFLIEVLRQSLDDCLKNNGVLYATGEIRFFEEVLFKKNNVPKFLQLINQPALIVSTIKPLNIDQILLNQINNINSQVINC